jgi:hypothetical protein
LLQPIFDFIDKLASDFSWRKIVILVCLMFVICLCWFAYEAQTATYQLAKYERTVAILEKLETLPLSDEKSKRVAENIYRGLDSVTKASEYQLSFVNRFSLEARQALWAASIWLLLMLFYIPGALRGDTEARNSVWALIFISTLIGGIGYFVPIKWGLWMYPIIGNFIIFVLLAWYGIHIKAK